MPMGAPLHYDTKTYDTKTSLSSAKAAAGLRPAAESADEPFGLYVHWPFCLSKCPYCDFNSHVREAVDQKRWREAYLKELEHSAMLAPGRRLGSIFFGGGTPSLMEPATVGAIVARALSLWPAEAGLEITLEANPTSSEAARFAAFCAAGINRLSLGIQALNDDDLAFLGRGHDRREAVRALDCARRRFSRLSLDLIYARPGQSVRAWRKELGEALALGTSHISAYELTVERGTAFFGAYNRGIFALPGEELAAELYETTLETLEAAGLFAYEISNHARPGEECRHNLLYWRYGEYAGIGPGAHGRLTVNNEVVATRKRRRPEDWLSAVENKGHGTVEEAPLTRAERIDEMVMMGLRLVEGISRERFRRLAGGDFATILDAGKLARLISAGFLSLDDERIAATASGRQRLNAVLLDLLG